MRAVWREDHDRPEGQFCLVAAALFGDPDVDLQYHCMKAISQKPAQK